ncbi:hypothetical protein [Actinomadura rugatobispora]|uniref:Uncharacterized protein n=1 Tax=Actinomadura rugatobispora TaxID=1994 RepID=A0ABW1AKK4_9ACTN
MKQTVYTASPESQQIHVWSLEADGKLTLVQVVDAGKCSPEQINAMIEVVSERHGESAVNEKLKAELMREYNSRYFNVPVPELPEDKPARRWWPFGKK